MSRFTRAASIPAAVVILLLAIPGVAQKSGAAGNSAQLFAETCSLCHSVGGGDLAGPDLIKAARLTPVDVRAALHRMEENVGPLPASEVEALVAFLEDPQIKQLAAAAQNPPVPAVVEQVERGSAKMGQHLFYGDVRLANGGAPCFACHTVGGRGGNLAVDLTLAHTRLNRAAIVSATAQPAYPLMRAAYAKHAVTEQESFDLAAFLKVAGAAARPGPQPRERAGLVHGAAAGGIVVVLAGVALILRSRRAGVRSRLVGR
ncbi:MAG: hypothetical protein ACXV5L_09430 [Thermoanaerobaculia bacterium]